MILNLSWLKVEDYLLTPIQIFESKGREILEESDELTVFVCKEKMFFLFYVVNNMYLNILLLAQIGVVQTSESASAVRTGLDQVEIRRI